MSLVAAGPAIEDDDAAITVAIGDEYLVGLRMDEDRGWPTQVRGVVAVLALVPLANLHEELAAARELEGMAVAFAVTRDPDVAVRIDRDAMFGRGPFVSVAWPAPGLHHPPGVVEFQDGRRRNAAPGLGRLHRRGALAVGDAGRTMQHPDVIAGIHGNAADHAGGPAIGQGLEVERIEFEPWHRAGWRRLLICARCDDGYGRHAGDNRDDGGRERPHGVTGSATRRRRARFRWGCRTSGAIVRDVARAAAAEPVVTAMYCLPSTLNETGKPWTDVPRRVCQSILPVLTSNARKWRSRSPTNATPPAVESTPVRNVARCCTLQTSLIVSTSYAASLPMFPSVPGISKNVGRRPCRPTFLELDLPAGISMQLWLSGMISWPVPVIAHRLPVLAALGAGAGGDPVDLRLDDVVRGRSARRSSDRSSRRRSGTRSLGRGTCRSAIVLPEDAGLADREDELLGAEVDEHALEHLVEIERFAGHVLEEPCERASSGLSASVELV